MAVVPPGLVVLGACRGSCLQAPWARHGKTAECGPRRAPPSALPFPPGRRRPARAHGLQLSETRREQRPVSRTGRCRRVAPCGPSITGAVWPQIDRRSGRADAMGMHGRRPSPARSVAGGTQRARARPGRQRRAGAPAPAGVLRQTKPKRPALRGPRPPRAQRTRGEHALLPAGRVASLKRGRSSPRTRSRRCG